MYPFSRRTGGVQQHQIITTVLPTLFNQPQRQG